MSVRTIYKCDKCGGEQDTEAQFWIVGVVADHIGHKPNCYAPTSFVEKMSMQVCRPCLESFGIYVQIKKNEPDPPVPTTEELICEIVRRATANVPESP
jgi:hypothetical protein